MFWILLVALLMLFGGSVFFTDQWARQHPWIYLGYWAVCGWLTLSAVLLSIFDMLVIRAAHRTARRAMEKRLLSEEEEEGK